MNPRRLSQVAGWMYVISGVGLAIASLFPSVLHFVDRLAVPEAAAPERIVGLYAGVGGGLTAGFGAAMIVVARAKDLASAVRGVGVGLVTWYVVDTGASLLHGSWQNAIGNTVFGAVGLVPILLLARREPAFDPA